MLGYPLKVNVFDKMWTNRRMDRHTDEKRTNEQTEFHQYRKEPSYHVDLCPCQV